MPSTVRTEIKIECLDDNCNNTPKDDNQKSKPRKGVEQKSSKKELDNPKIIDQHKSDDDGDHVKGRKGMNPGNFLAYILKLSLKCSCHIHFSELPSFQMTAK